MGYQAKLQKVHIKNFRSIVDETIYFDNFNIYVGLNDCGKSNVLKALNLFFNGQTENGHLLDFPRDYAQHGKTGKGKAKEIVIEISLIIPDNFKEAGIKSWKKVWRDNDLFSDNLSEIVDEYSKCTTLLKRIKFEYIPAVKSESFFQELLLELYNSMTISADSALHTANLEYSKALTELTQNLSENVKNKVGLDSSVMMPDKLSVLFRNLKINTKDENIKDIDLNHRGDGIKARHIPSILLTIAHNIKNSRKRNSVDYSFIWGYEEPENGVEFFACSQLADELYSYSKELQLIITTHSPAIYSKSNMQDCKCYYVYKTECGDSKYDTNYSFIELNKNIGLMPLIAPYVQDFQKVIEERSSAISSLEEENKRINQMTNRVILYTEGKTDVKYLKKAFETFKEYGDVSHRIEYYDIENARFTGDGELKKIFDYLQKGNDSNIKIMMFDRDVEDKIIEYEFEKGQNKVYRFNIPIPPHRKSNDKISIEHFIEDDNLSVVDTMGRRLFMAKDFDYKGISLDGKYTFNHAKNPLDAKYNPLEIINGSADKKVFSVNPNDNKNYAMSKDDFVNHIINEDEGFCFDLSVYKLILDLICRIIADADTSKT